MKNLDFDRKHLWHPYTSTTNPSRINQITSTNGCTIYTEDNTPLIDGMASWWSAIHGYGQKRIIKAIQEQSQNLCHIMFGGLTHSPAIALGKKLLSMLPESFEHIFYVDSGSVAVEVAMKTAVQYQYNRGEKSRNRFLTVLNGYHGDTAGAMSVCDPISGIHKMFSQNIQKQFFAPAPPLGFTREITKDDFAEIERIAKQHENEIAAVILEPIVQATGGMRIYSPDYLRKIRKLCDKRNFVLIFDEIATGFGRTGKMFAMEHAGVVPDIICIGKALTGGMMTLAAMITSNKVARIACKDAMPLMHGPTFMANPLACAASLANLELLTAWDWEGKVARIQKFLEDELFPLKKHKKVAGVRVLGAIGAVELKEKIDIPRFQSDCIARGAWLRPLGNIAYIMPAYIISDEELKILTDAISFAVGNQ